MRLRNEQTEELSPDDELADYAEVLNLKHFRGNRKMLTNSILLMFGILIAWLGIFVFIVWAFYKMFSQI